MPGQRFILSSVADTQIILEKAKKPHRQLLYNIVAFKLRLASYMAKGLQVEVTSSLAEGQESQANCKLLVLGVELNYCALEKRSKIGLAMVIKA